MRKPRRPSGTGARTYPRTARLSELLREIVADELERLDDPRLELITVTEARMDPDLRRATVWVSSLEGPSRDEEMLAALADHRARLQAAFARQTKVRATPELSFKPDDVARSAQRIEDLLRASPPPADDPADNPAGEPDDGT